MAKNKIIERVEKTIERNRSRLALPPKALKVLGISETNTKVVVTIYEDKVVITRGE